MKNVMHLRNKCGLLAFLVILLLHMSMIGQAQTKRGLIVAIGDYPESGQSPDWRDISSVNDIPLIRSALQKQGFKSDNIRSWDFSRGYWQSRKCQYEMAEILCLDFVPSYL